MLASPSLVRKASFKGGGGGGGGGSLSAPGTASTTPTAAAPPGMVASSPAPVSPPDSLSTSAAWDYRYSNGGSSSSTTSPRSPEFHDGTVVGSGSLTWLQRQQQKLRERREGQRPAHEARLLNELRIVQHRTTTTTTSTTTASSSDAGYTSDHADLCTPLHINTAGSQAGSPSGGAPAPGPLPQHQQQHLPPPQKSGGSAPASPLLPSRASSRRLHTAATGYSTLGRQKSDSSFDRERPFVAVKRAHEQTRKYTSDTTQSSPMSPPHELIITRQRAESDSSGLLTTVDGPGSREVLVHHQQPQQQQHSVGSSANNQDHLAGLIASLSLAGATTPHTNTCTSAWHTQMREESFSSWRTTSVSDEPGSPTHSSSPRPQTPAFPVHPRTPYVNNSSQQFEMASTAPGLPPKSPTTQRRLSYSGSFKNLRKWPSSSSVSSKDRSPSPVSDHSQTVHQQNISMISNSSSGVSSSSRIINAYQTTPHSSGFVSDGYLQQSPKNSAVLNGSTGQSSPTVYYGHSRRSSLHSNSEPPQDVSPAHVKFVRDTSRFWYKPTISREEAINMLKDQPPGTFVVRDSNSFPGAFGLALKVATPPPNVQGKSSSSSDPASELVRHFLIEPTSRGVRLKGCSNEPVFSSLSALVYQHSLMPMALPCRLLLPEGDGSRLTAESPGAVSNAQLLLAQGAACNVLYLFSMDTESLTGPQAIKKTVQQLFTMQPLPLATVVHFKVSGQGITLTDNKRQLFFRRHYPVNTISYCGLDPDDHRWSQKNEETGMPISSNRCFGFVARKQASKTDNQCHIFAELEPEQPASAIVNFVSKVMMNCGNMKANIV
ncbi:tensin-1 [Schistocerca cancellata]|uniref:tensin-1 n=1 Tax=Schistocerca cancellata TaxID=274614 RepID=UPI00211827D9|nr:tensin-1 [Schistocerca cancellata]